MYKYGFPRILALEKTTWKDGIEVKPDLENSIIMFDGSLIIQKAEWPDRKRDEERLN